MTGQDNIGQDRTGQDRAGQDRTGQDRTGRDGTGWDGTGTFKLDFPGNWQLLQFLRCFLLNRQIHLFLFFALMFSNTYISSEIIFCSSLHGFPSQEKTLLTLWGLSGRRELFCSKYRRRSLLTVQLLMREGEGISLKSGERAVNSIRRDPCNS